LLNRFARFYFVPSYNEPKCGKYTKMDTKIPDGHEIHPNFPS
jgi:hypothetical protein